MAGQVLVSPYDFFERTLYLQAKATLGRLLELGVVPVVNENDALADADLRFGDNDRIAALLAHLVGADLLVLLTDTAGVYTADPRLDAEASLIEEILEVDRALREVAAGGAGLGPGQRRHGVEAGRGPHRRVVGGADGDRRGRPRRRPARRGGAASPGWARSCSPARSGSPPASCGSPSRCPPRASSWSTPALAGRCEERNTSLLPVGVTAVRGDFEAGDAVELTGPDGETFAKGLVRTDSTSIRRLAGERGPAEVIHRDELVLVRR